MQTDISDYINTPGEKDQSEDQYYDKQIAYQIRRQVHEDKELSFGARFYFSYLLDGSTDNSRSNLRGSILISVKKLVRSLGCSRRVIYSWNEELVKRRYIWISKVSISSNMDPFNMYNISALKPLKVQKQNLTRDGMWGGGDPRPRVTVAPGIGGRDGKWRAENATEKLQNPPLLPDSALGSSKNEPLSAVENTTASSNGYDCESHKVRLPVVESAAASSKNCGSPSQKGALKEDTVSGSTVGKSTSKTMSKGKKPVPAKERRFLDDMDRYARMVAGETRGQVERAKFGKQWRERFREDPDRAERALLDAKGMHKEGLIHKSFGATWNTLWNQFASRKEVAA